jgi:circadian clock protein KaiB
MRKPRAKKVAEVFTQAPQASGGEKYLLHLYVAGPTPKSVRAIANLKSLCEAYLPDAYDLEVIDIYQQPVRAKAAQIIAVPTLIKQLPPPLRRLIGDLSDLRRLLVGLDLQPKR